MATPPSATKEPHDDGCSPAAGRRNRSTPPPSEDGYSEPGCSPPARQTAMFELAGELAAAILARTLCIDIKVAVEGQHLAAGDWARYAAEFRRRQRAGSGTSTARVRP